MIAQLYEILDGAKSVFTKNGWGDLLYLAQKRVNNNSEYSQTAIVIPQTQDNYSEVSPTDNKGNYAYIRLLDNTARLSIQKTGSCSSYKATFSLRIVGVWVDSGVTDYALMDKLMGDLKNYAAYNKFGKYQLKIEPLRALVDANEIYNDELGVDMSMRNIAIAAIDFYVEFILKNCNKPPEKCPVDVAPIACN